ncbi:MAG: NAD(P)-binding domain-containing protein, partial [Candidatus Nanopelagicales bacterium]
MTPEPKAPARDPFDLPDVSGLSVGVLGGTGEQGRGLAYRWSLAGHSVILGSRDAGRAQAAATELGNGVRAAANVECASEADLVVVAVPWVGHGELL